MIRITCKLRLPLAVQVCSVPEQLASELIVGASRATFKFTGNVRTQLQFNVDLSQVYHLSCSGALALVPVLLQCALHFLRC